MAQFKLTQHTYSSAGVRERHDVSIEIHERMRLFFPWQLLGSFLQIDSLLNQLITARGHPDPEPGIRFACHTVPAQFDDLTIEYSFLRQSSVLALILVGRTSI